jgi:hypothetical protein
VLGQAEELARSITHPTYQSEALVSVAEALTQAGEFAQAEALIRSITNPTYQSKVLLPLAMAHDPHQRSIARILTLDHWEKSLKALTNIRSDALTVIVSELAIVANEVKH